MSQEPTVKSERLFFVALLPPQSIQEEVTQIKQYFATHYQSRHALKSPPHVTLQPPFKWEADQVARLEACLQSFTANSAPVPMILDGFSAFKPRVIFVNVLKTPELLTVQQQLAALLASTLGIVDPAAKTRSFSPHMTVAFRDLTRENFKVAWAEFAQQPIHHEFSVTHLTLLQHQGDRWTIFAEFPFTRDLS